MLAAEPGIEVAGEAGSGPEAVALARASILMDLRMPGGDWGGVVGGVSGRTAAVITAIERGLLPPPGRPR